MHYSDQRYILREVYIDALGTDFFQFKCKECNVPCHMFGEPPVFIAAQLTLNIQTISLNVRIKPCTTKENVYLNTNPANTAH